MISGGDNKRALAQVDGHHVVGDDACSKIASLLPHQVHQLGAGNRVLLVIRRKHHPIFFVERRIKKLGQFSCRKSGEILDLSRQVQLPQRQRAILLILPGNRAFKNQGFQVRSSTINRS